MPTDRDSFFAATEHRKPNRILYHAGFTPDLKRRVIERVGTDDIHQRHNRYWDDPNVMHPLARARRYPSARQPTGKTLATGATGP